MRHTRRKSRFPDQALRALFFCGLLLTTTATAADDPALPDSVVATLKGHTEIVYAVAFSPDGKSVLTGSFDKTLKLWETATGKEIKTFGGPAGHQNLVLSVAFSSDGRTLASGAADNTAKLWDIQKTTASEPIKNFAHANLVDAVAFNPDGSQLATGSHDGIVRIWDVAKGEPLRQITAHALPMLTQVYCVAWSPDGKQIVSGSLDHSLKLWDAATGTLVREFKGYKEKDALPVFDASTVVLLGSALGQGPFLAASAVIPRRIENNLHRGHREGVFCAAFSPDGKLLASGSSDCTIKIWNVADGSVVRELVNPRLKPALSTANQTAPAHPGWVYSLRFTPTGAHLISAGRAPRNHGYLAAWSVTDGKLLYGDELPLGAFYSVAISPDGQLLALACGPRSRQFQEVNSYILKMPDLDRSQASSSGRSQNAAPSGLRPFPK
jgi:WD40 repeat protein